MTSYKEIYNIDNVSRIHMFIMLIDGVILNIGLSDTPLKNKGVFACKWSLLDRVKNE